MLSGKGVEEGIAEEETTLAEVVAAAATAVGVAVEMRVTMRMLSSQYKASRLARFSTHLSKSGWSCSLLKPNLKLTPRRWRSTQSSPMPHPQ